MWPILSMVIGWWVVGAGPTSQPVELPAREAPKGQVVSAWKLGVQGRRVRIWGGEPTAAPMYFGEVLPALFERRLVLDEGDLTGAALNWVFTGELAGFTVRVDQEAVTVTQRFYDSFALNTCADGKVAAGRHPEKTWQQTARRYTGQVRDVSVTLDHRLNLVVALNGEPVVEQPCLFEVSGHQLRYEGKGNITGRLLAPETAEVTIRVNPGRRHQTMIGFGGIATPTAYAQLSQQGKRRWWELVCEYNLLIQREYPIGTQLNPAMDNWDRLEDATPHYYGDNFPNGEISDFAYIRILRKLGGKVWFEFWALPPWVTHDWTDDQGKVQPHVADVDQYARAMVGYCQASRDKAGAPPEVVGIQNEICQPLPVLHQMVSALRKSLDEAGFRAVRIHSNDAGTLAHSIQWVQWLQQSARSWETIDYAASHVYDYQGHFHDPDGFDALLKQWKAVIGSKPFLSSEMCVNDPQYQLATYRVALAMGQLYHKNLTLADASALCYCWTLLNAVQRSYGWTRSLCVPDPAHGFVPVASSCQLRVFGAYSRRVRKGMARVDVEGGGPGLLATAFVGDRGQCTVVLLNRSTAWQQVHIEAVDAIRFTSMETCDPCQQNTAVAADLPGDGGAVRAMVAPGAIVTLSNVELRRLPEGFDADVHTAPPPSSAPG